jgi:hypothetical protein
VVGLFFQIAGASKEVLGGSGETIIRLPRLLLAMISIYPHGVSEIPSFDI